MILVDEAGRWHAWILRSTPDDAGDEDRMTTVYWTSADRPVVAPARYRAASVFRRVGRRGTRITHPLSWSRCRPVRRNAGTAAENWHERTGPAAAAGGDLVVDEGAGVPVPVLDGAFRYASQVTITGGEVRR